MQRKNYLLFLETDFIQRNIIHPVKRNTYFPPVSVLRYCINDDKVRSSNIDTHTLRHTTLNHIHTFQNKIPTERVGVVRKEAHFLQSMESRQPPAEGLKSTKIFELQKKSFKMRNNFQESCFSVEIHSVFNFLLNRPLLVRWRFPRK